jgi:hypothetical protein
MECFHNCHMELVKEMSYFNSYETFSNCQMDVAQNDHGHDR